MRKTGAPSRLQGVCVLGFRQGFGESAGEAGKKNSDLMTAAHTTGQHELSQSPVCVAPMIFTL